MALNVSLVIILIYFVITIFLYFYQRNLLYHPNFNSKSSNELNHKIEKISIQSDDTLVAWYHIKNENFKTLVFFHGNAGNLSNRIYKLNELSKMNLNYLIFAYRGFNGNNGKPTEEGLYKDADNVIKWLKSKNILENQIVLYGESLGTAISVNVAQYKEFAGIILGSPILIMHGKKDKIVPFEMVQKIYNLSNNPKFNYFNDYDDHMMEYNLDLVNSINSFINNLN